MQHLFSEGLMHYLPVAFAVFEGLTNLLRLLSD
jgi:hypothetical protein